MRYSTALLSLLPACLAVPAFAPRQVEASKAPELLSTITELSSAVTDLTTAVNNFDNQWYDVIPRAIAVAATEAKVDFTTLKATYITWQSCNFTAAESSQIVQALAGQINPIQGSLQALENKAPQLKSIPLNVGNSVVFLDLHVLKDHTDSLISAIIDKVTVDQVGLLNLGKGILDAAFDKAIAAF